jgi:hypothetical protein
MAEAASLDRPIESGQVDRSFLWRRPHSLSGVLPLGGFLCYHLFENLAALRGPTPYTVAWVLFVGLSAATLNILFKLRFAA